MEETKIDGKNNKIIMFVLGAVILAVAGYFILKGAYNVPIGQNTVPPGAKIVEITASGFSPSILEIRSGETVAWVNKDAAQHWPASAPHPVHNAYPETGGCIGSKFDACRGLNQGDVFSFTFNQSGNWKYHDHLNPVAPFFGSIIVTNGVSPAPSSSQSPAPSAALQQASLNVSAQSLSGNQIIIAGLYLDKPGFVVIHKDVNGAPSAIIGHSDLISGSRTNLVVSIDKNQAGSRVFAMLHYDANNNGVYDSADEGTAVKVEGGVVVKPVIITSSPKPSVSSAPSPASNSLY